MRMDQLMWRDMITIKKVGWAFIILSILSWIGDVIVGSFLMLNGKLDLVDMLIWTYCALPFLFIGIFMVQYEPYTEEHEEP